jgi:hypothetical protein
MRPFDPAWFFLALSSACTSGPLPEDRVRPDTQEDPAETGVVTVTPATLELVVPVGERSVAGVIVGNEGPFSLTLIAASMTEDAAGQLQTDEATNAGRTLVEGGSFEILVVCRLSTAEPAVGVLTIQTDDAARPRVDVPIDCQAADETDGG